MFAEWEWPAMREAAELSAQGPGDGEPPWAALDGARSALAELRGATRLVQAVLLALDLARVAREQTVLAQLRLEVGVVALEGAGDAEADRSGLADRTAALDLRPHVVV